MKAYSKQELTVLLRAVTQLKTMIGWSCDYNNNWQDVNEDYAIVLKLETDIEHELKDKV